MTQQLRINGVARPVDVDADTPVLWVLRDVLGMTGTKFGCGIGLCGACTVHVDGKATRSCITPVSAVGRSSVSTIEALANSATGKALQKAWQDLEVPQCGYCQSGQLMSAASLLASNKSPTDEQIDSAMAGNVAAAALITAFATASSRPHVPSTPIQRKPDMIIDRLAEFTDNDAAAGVSRRGFLQVGLAVGGGLLVGVGAPPAGAATSAEASASFLAQRVRSHRCERASDRHLPLRGGGPGHLHVDPDAGGRGTRGAAIFGPLRARAAERQAVRQPHLRLPVYRRLDLDSRRIRADAARRRRREAAACSGRGAALERVGGGLPGKQCGSHPHSVRAEAEVRRAGGGRVQSSRNACSSDFTSARAHPSGGSSIEPYFARGRLPRPRDRRRPGPRRRGCRRRRRPLLRLRERPVGHHHIALRRPHRRRRPRGPSPAGADPPRRPGASPR